MKKPSIVDEARNFLLWVFLGLILQAYKFRTLLIYILIPVSMGYGLAHLEKVIMYFLYGINQV